MNFSGNCHLHNSNNTNQIMVLSQVEISGFKSFARKTNIPFRPGVTAVVGPNGCGKTNVVDAIRWVLGEQKTGVLRSDRMENVIFNGTRNRKPLGLAEVTLGLVNHNGLLPIPQSEVQVTRRLYRSGESEYLLNREPCRLRDIVELFQDTGIGPDSYSIIELKMVEGILSDDPSDRRHLFEEAAGVSKYKHRRKQTTKKLEDVQEDLERVGDVLREVEAQVANLRRQMQRAKRYQKLKDEWRQGQAALARHTYQELQRNLGIHQAQLQELSGQSSEHDGHITGSEVVLEKLKAEQLQIENEQKAVAQKLHSLESGLIRTEETLKYLKERRTTLQESQERWTREKLVQEEKRLRLQESLGALEIKIQQVRNQHQSCQEKAQQAQTALTEAKQQKATAKEHLEQVTSELGGKRQTQLEADKERSRLESGLERIEEQITTANSRLVELESQSKHTQSEIGHLEAELQSKEQKLSEVVKTSKSMTTQQEKARETLEKSRLKLSGISHQINSLESQLEWLKSAIGEGSSQQDAMQWLFSQNLPGIIGTLGDVVEAPEAWQPLIAAVLGEESHWVVCDTRTTALDAIERLRNTKKGVLTFLPLDSVTKSASNNPTDNFTGPGIIGSIMEVITNSEPLHSLFQRRLGSVARVEGRPDRTLLENAASAGITVATKNGEVFLPLGAVRGGVYSTSRSGAIGRNTKIRELESRLTSEKENQTQCQHETEALDKELQKLTTGCKDLQNQTELARRAAEQSRIALNRLTVIHEQHQAQKAKSHQDIESLTQMRLELHDKLKLLIADRETSEQETKRLEKSSTTAGRQLQKLDEQVEILASQDNQTAMALVEVTNQRDNLEKEQSRIHQQLKEWDETLIAREEEVQRSIQEIEDIDSRQLKEEQGLVERFKERDNLWSARDSFQEALINHRERMKEEESRLREARRHQESTTDRKHHLELEITRIEAEIRQIVERLKDYDIPVEMLESGVGQVPCEPDNVIVTEEQLTELKRRIERMEPVNLLAIGEFDSVNQRYEFLKSQRDDLLESRGMLEDTIQRINEVAQQKFFNTFQIIRKNFQEVFRQLFGDGDVDLLLSGQDLLESDISIWANPSGKKLKTLALMSGGEKALTAIALLFSIYRVKPSPFCVLDEVDAPLDDANIDRFIRILRAFSNNTQFIVITHNKRTMEAADQLHGITMEEEGVSKLVSVKLESDA
jgi:chromosome segregation protein